MCGNAQERHPAGGRHHEKRPSCPVALADNLGGTIWFDRGPWKPIRKAAGTAGEERM